MLSAYPVEYWMIWSNYIKVLLLVLSILILLEYIAHFVSVFWLEEGKLIDKDHSLRLLFIILAVIITSIIA